MDVCLQVIASPIPLAFFLSYRGAKYMILMLLTYHVECRNQFADLTHRVTI